MSPLVEPTTKPTTTTTISKMVPGRLYRHSAGSGTFKLTTEFKIISDPEHPIEVYAGPVLPDVMFFVLAHTTPELTNVLCDRVLVLVYRHVNPFRVCILAGWQNCRFVEVTNELR